MQDEDSALEVAVIDAPSAPRLRLRPAAGPAPTCDGCVAHCCRYVAVEIERPRVRRQYDQIRWMLLHQNVAVFVGSDRRWYVEFRTRCRELQGDGRCASYHDRPDLCRNYEVDACPVWGDGAPHVVRFESAQSFSDYVALSPGERRARSASPRRPRPPRSRARSGAGDPKPGRSPRR